LLSFDDVLSDGIELGREGGCLLGFKLLTCSFRFLLPFFSCLVVVALDVEFVALTFRDGVAVALVLPFFSCSVVVALDMGFVALTFREGVAIALVIELGSEDSWLLGSELG
jgi:hypothetical protein